MIISSKLFKPLRWYLAHTSDLTWRTMSGRSLPLHHKLLNLPSVVNSVFKYQPKLWFLMYWTIMLIIIVPATFIPFCFITATSLFARSRTCASLSEAVGRHCTGRVYGLRLLVSELIINTKVWVAFVCWCFVISFTASESWPQREDRYPATLFYTRL